MPCSVLEKVTVVPGGSDVEDIVESWLLLVVPVTVAVSTVATTSETSVVVNSDAVEDVTEATVVSATVEEGTFVDGIGEGVDSGTSDTVSGTFVV